MSIINTLVENIILCSMDSDTLQMEPQVAQAMEDLRDFMFQKVYRNPIAKGEESKARAILQQLYLYYMKHPEEIPADFQPQLDFEGMPRTICDYIACFDLITFVNYWSLVNTCILVTSYIFH